MQGESEVNLRKVNRNIYGIKAIPSQNRFYVSHVK